jgi:hypothetical protein
LQRACKDSGVCNSCKHYRGAPQNCPTWPEQPFVL